MEKINSTGLIELSVIIYDNSPNEQCTYGAYNFKSFEYIHDSRNIGVVPAYQYAAKYCEKSNINWLLRLDQDSIFDIELIENFKKAIKVEAPLVVVPKIISNNKIVSPTYYRLGGVNIPLEHDGVGINDSRITFINSMSFIKVSNKLIYENLNHQEFMLDLSDHEFALSLPLNSIFVIDCFVSHSLSITENTYVSLNRYRSIIDCEYKFIKKTNGILGLIIYKFRLIYRLIKFLNRKSFKLAFLTFNALFK